MIRRWTQLRQPPCPLMRNSQLYKAPTLQQLAHPDLAFRASLGMASR